MSRGPFDDQSVSVEVAKLRAQEEAHQSARFAKEGSTKRSQRSIFGKCRGFHRALCATHLEKRNGRGAGIAAQADGPRCRRTTVEIEPRGRRLETCRDTPPHGHLRALPALGDGPPTCEAEWRSAQGPSRAAARSTRRPRTPIGPPSKTPILDCPRPSALFGPPAVATVHPHPLYPLPPRLPPCRAAPRLCIDRPPFDVTVEPCPCSPACPLPPIPQCGSHRTRR